MKKLIFMLILIPMVSNCNLSDLDSIDLFNCTQSYIKLRTSNDCIDGEAEDVYVTSDERSRINGIMEKSPANTCISVTITPKYGSAAVQGWIYKSADIVPSSFTYLGCTTAQ